MLAMVKVNNKNKRMMACCIFFKLERMHINLIFFIVNFEHVFVSQAQDKINETTKKLKKKKNTLKNRAVSLKHVPVA